MAETAEELAKRTEVREALDQTTGQKPRAAAETGDKFWFVTHLLLLVACGVLYYLIGSRFIPFPQTQVDLAHRLLHGASMFIIVPATTSVNTLSVNDPVAR